MFFAHGWMRRKLGFRAGNKATDSRMPAAAGRNWSHSADFNRNQAHRKSSRVTGDA
jgi:hypothetical protein